MAYAQNTVTLDEAIRTSANQIMEQILMRSVLIFQNFDESSNVRVAILDFTASSATVSNFISIELTRHFLTNPRFVIIDRQNLDMARRELEFSMTEEVGDMSAQRIGHFVGAQIVVFGSISQLGNAYLMQTRAISVEEGIVLGQEKITVAVGDMERLFAQRTPRPPRQPNNFFCDRVEFASRNQIRACSHYLIET